MKKIGDIGFAFQEGQKPEPVKCLEVREDDTCILLAMRPGVNTKWKATPLPFTTQSFNYWEIIEPNEEDKTDGT